MAIIYVCLQGLIDCNTQWLHYATKEAKVRRKESCYG